MGTRRRVVVLVALAAILIGTVLAFPALAASKSVQLTADNKFSPGTQTVAVGDTVNFVWKAGFHDVKFSDGQSSGAPTADTGTNYSRTFSAAGSYGYICTVHESVRMKGTITVQAAGDSSTTTVAGSLPHTGPEESGLPIVGGILLVGGVAYLVRMRLSRS